MSVRLRIPRFFATPSCRASNARWEVASNEAAFYPVQTYMLERIFRDLAIPLSGSTSLTVNSKRFKPEKRNNIAVCVYAHIVLRYPVLPI